MKELMKNIFQSIKQKVKKPADGNKEPQKIDTVLNYKIQPGQKYMFGKIISFSFDRSSIQMSAVKHSGKSFTVLEIKKEYLTQSQIEQFGFESLITNSISDFYEAHKSRFAKVILTLTGEETLYRTFMMPELKSKELDSAVQFEVKKLIPFPVEECIFDYRVIQKIKTEKKSQLKISLHAATKANIHKYLAPFKNLGITIDRIYHSQDSIGQLLGLLKDFDENHNYTLINIGHKVTELSFYYGNTLEFSRSSTVNSEILGSSRDSDLRIEYFAEAIVNEIQNSLDYYTGQFNAGINNKFLVYGDFAYSEDLLALLNEKLDINLIKFPIEDLRISFENKDEIESYPVSLPVMATGVNTALLPDMLPLNLKQDRNSEQLNARIKVAGYLVTFILALSWIFTAEAIDRKNENLEIHTKQIEVFKNSTAFHTYNLIKREIALDLNYMELAKMAPSFLHLNLKELSYLTPEKIKLFNLDFNTANEFENYYLQGVVRSSDIPPEVTLAEFVENLESSAYYDSVQIVRHVKKKVKHHFEIEFLIKMRGNV